MKNMGQLYPWIDTIILLSAPVATIMERLAARDPGGYGQTAQERQRVADLIAMIEPLLRRAAQAARSSHLPRATGRITSRFSGCRKRAACTF